MKGLLKNNFYAAGSSVKTLSALMALLGGFVAFAASQQLLICYMLAGIIGFSANAFAGMGKDYASKWGKYKLTLPVRRADIVKSYFASHLAWLLVGMAFAGAAMGFCWLFHGFLFDRDMDAWLVFSAGISISLFAGAAFFPLFYLGGEERSGVFLAASLLCGIGATMGIAAWINFFFGPQMAPWQIALGGMAMMACALLAFGLSYPVTAVIFKRKEY